MKQKVRKQKHQFMNFVHVLVNYAAGGQNRKRKWFCARILKNELGSVSPKVSVLNQKFTKLIGQINAQNKTKV